MHPVVVRVVDPLSVSGHATLLIFTDKTIIDYQLLGTAEVIPRSSKWDQLAFLCSSWVSLSLII